MGQFCLQIDLEWLGLFFFTHSLLKNHSKQNENNSLDNPNDDDEVGAVV